jgi:hypothetical protein
VAAEGKKEYEAWKMDGIMVLMLGSKRGYQEAQRSTLPEEYRDPPQEPE